MNGDSKTLRVAEILSLGMLLGAGAAAADEIYHWVDENGVLVFSQEAPPETVTNAKKLDLGNDVLSQDGIGISEADDPEGYEAHRAGMDALWADIEARRDKNRAQQGARSSPGAIYPNLQEDAAYPLAFPAYGLRPANRPPRRPSRRPPRPEEPESRPSPPATLKRP